MSEVEIGMRRNAGLRKWDLGTGRDFFFFQEGWHVALTNHATAPWPACCSLNMPPHSGLKALASAIPLLKIMFPQLSVEPL